MGMALGGPRLVCISAREASRDSLPECALAVIGAG